MHSLYSFIADYKGGTYIVQVRADDLESAIASWVKGKYYKAIEGMREDDSTLANQFTDEKAVQIDGCKNLWYVCVSTDSGLLGINIVKTLDE